MKFSPQEYWTIVEIASRLKSSSFINNITYSKYGTFLLSDADSVKHAQELYLECKKQIDFS